MTNSSRSCKCDGSNENCAWCYGTGIVQGKLDLHFSGKAKYPKTEPQVQSIPKKLGILIPVDLRSIGKRKNQRDEVYEQNKPKRKLTTNQRVNVAVPGKTKEETKNIKTSVRCPYCSPKAGPIKSTRINSHCIRVHNRIYSTTNPTKPTKFNKTKPNKNQKGSNPTSKPSSKPTILNSHNIRVVPLTRQDNNRMETRLDSTREYAHNFREGGRFGSHPSHDGFDDESGPD